jgi:hypothetical protein
MTVDPAEQYRPPPQGTRRRATTGLLTGAVALLLIVPACSSSSTPATLSTTTTTTSAVVLPNQGAAEIAACTADAKTLEVALGAYMAEKGAYPSPPSPWSAASYVANYAPLTAGGNGGPFMANAPPTTSYVIEYDSAGHIWVAPPGSYGSYDKGQDFDAGRDVCDPAIG